MQSKIKEIYESQSSSSISIEKQVLSNTDRIKALEAKLTDLCASMGAKLHNSPKKQVSAKRLKRATKAQLH